MAMDNPAGLSSPSAIVQAAPEHSPDIWMVSCRPTSCMNRFARRLLMFQPDTRLFCPKGTKCRLMDTADHMQYYTHLTKKQHATLNGDKTGKGKRKEKGKRSKHNYVPRVPHVHDLGPTTIDKTPTTTAVASSKPRQQTGDVVGGDDEDEDEGEEEEAEDGKECATKSHDPTGNAQLSAPSQSQPQTEDHALFPRNRNIIIYVHGFRQRYYRILSCLTHLLSRLKQPAEEEGAADPLSPIVMGFIWPCHVNKAAYVKARTKTKRAGLLLRRTVAILQSMGNTVTLLGYSLGARVSLHALLDSDVRTNQLVLCAAAVPSDCFGPKGEFPASRLAVDNVRVLHSPADEALLVAFRVGELLPALAALSAPPTALGLVGATGKTVPANVSSHNVSASVKLHSPHIYLCSREVRRILCNVLGLPWQEGYEGTTDAEEGFCIQEVEEDWLCVVAGKEL